MGILPRFGSDDDVQQNLPKHQIAKNYQHYHQTQVPKKFSPNDVYNTGDIIESTASSTCTKIQKKMD